METKQPSIGDRVLFSNPNCDADRVGTVVAAQDGRFGRTWEVKLEDGSTEHISGFVGTAEDRGGHYRTLNKAGIGHYLIEASKTKTFRQITGALCDRVHPNRPTTDQARAILVENGVSDADHIVEELLDDANDLMDAWQRDEEYESRCESAEARRNERDYE